MAKLNDPVTELVQIPIRISVVDFLDIFVKELEPVLLAQPGIISVLTGPTTEADGEKETHPFIVSLTQWGSMDAHAAFLASPSAGPFFAKLESLTLGPPTVEHYQFGRLSPFVRKKRYARVMKSYRSADQEGPWIDKRQVQDHNYGVVMGQCVEVPLLNATVLFGDEPQFNIVDATDPSRYIRSAYTVRWECFGVAQGAENL